MAESLDVAIEQARHWRTYLTAQEAAAAVGIYQTAHSWGPVIRRLAVLWREMQAEKTKHILKRAA
jgi:hypothetical protein